MAKTLVEAYADRLSAAEKVLGINMSREKKVFTARILNTVNRRLTEALDNSVGTQRSDMGAYKVFCLNMANVVAPSLIAPEILLDVPMDAITGNIVYNEYVAGSNKGNVVAGQSVFNNPFALPQEGNADGNYTAGMVAVDDDKFGEASSNKITVTLDWSKVAPNSLLITTAVGKTAYTSTETGCSAVDSVTVDGVALTASTDYTTSSGAVTLTQAVANAAIGKTIAFSGTGDGASVKGTGTTYYIYDVDGTIYYSTTKPTTSRVTGNGSVEFKRTATGGSAFADAELFYGSFRDATYDSQGTKGFVKLPDNGTPVIAEGGVFSIQYYYDNVYVPQNDLPILNVRKNRIAVEAKVRRIAINYAQLAAYQNSTDYGEDLQSELTKQAVGQLKYDIDVEAVRTLLDLAQQAGAEAGEIAGVGSNRLEWNRTQPIGVSLQEHYASFAQVLAQASQAIYDRTRKFMANFAVVASDILPILDLVPGFQKASTNNINGPFYAGNVNGLKVYVTPSYAKGQFVVGLNAGRLEGSAAALCMYMPIAPTQLLGFADGTMSQGFSTAYDIVGLNKWLVVEGLVTGDANTYWAQNAKGTFIHTSTATIG